METLPLESKKNKVFKIHKENSCYIRKDYEDENRMVKEYKILKLMAENDVNIPTIYKQDKDSIYMEYIEGTLLLDYFIELEKKHENHYDEFIKKVVKAHQDIYSALHTFEKNTILKDMNFRNYLVKEDKIYRIDFEDCEPGKIESDIGKLAAFALTYDPVNTV
ncbi:MAG: hypothetical protein MJA31_01395, partial [Clostridia bacterium]|nr:hypothetical protein [Clostridia bacterium]